MLLEEYLHTSFELDCEYVDGAIVERGSPDLAHSKTHAHVAGIFGDLARTRPFHGNISLRSRVRPTRIRIPDVSIYAGTEPTEDVPSTPPLVAVEILSDDYHSNLMQKFEEYSTWGVPYIWLVNPRGRKLHRYVDGSLTEIAALEIPEYDVRITPTEIFG
jgi:Uma2 family endonuclease